MAKQRQRPVFISPGQRFKLSCWMVKYAKEISGLQRKEIAERAFADTGIKVSAAQISDIASPIITCYRQACRTCKNPS